MKPLAFSIAFAESVRGVFGVDMEQSGEVLVDADGRAGFAFSRKGLAGGGDGGEPFRSEPLHGGVLAARFQCRLAGQSAAQQ